MTFIVCPSWPDYTINEHGVIRNKRGERKPFKATTGYLYIVMRNKGIKKACAVHRLVAEAFIGDAPPGKEFVAHSDGDKENNNFKNLRYVNRSENEMDKVLHGTSNRGENYGRSVLKQDQVVEIKNKLKMGLSSYKLADIYGVAASTIRSINQGKSWAWL